MLRTPRRRVVSALRDFLDGESAGGIVLMVAAALAILVANSPLRDAYHAAKAAYVGPLSVEHWINDGLMALFFVVVGLEIKREVVDGGLSTWPRRVLPGVAAAGGMVVPALIYAAFNAGTPAIRGWAIPSATDIAFALGVLSLLGNRVPASLRVFLAALAILDDLGAVVIIAVFYTADLSVLDLTGAGMTAAALVTLSRLRVAGLAPYLLLGAVLWLLTYRSGVHATIAGVVLAITIPIRTTPFAPDPPGTSPLHRLEHALIRPVAFVIVPLFGFANAGVTVVGMPAEALAGPITLGVALGLLVGKVVGVFGASYLTIRLGYADLPAFASRRQLLGVCLLCGIGFTMSLFVALLSFPGARAAEDAARIGILVGSVASALLGTAVLLRAHAEVRPSR